MEICWALPTNPHAPPHTLTGLRDNPKTRLLTMPGRQPVAKCSMKRAGCSLHSLVFLLQW